MTGWGRDEDAGIADAKLEVEEAGGGADAAVQGVGLLHRVAVLQGVDPHPRLVWGETHRGRGDRQVDRLDRQVDRQVEGLDRQVDTQVRHTGRRVR